MKIGVNIKDRDLGAKKIRKAIKELAAKPYVKVGVQGKSALDKKKSHEDGVQFTNLSAPSVVDIAMMHEFGGDPGPPERSFLRSTLDENRQKYIKAAEKIRDMVLSGKYSVERGLRILGMMMVADVKKKIKDGIKPELADSTIRKKNSRQIKAAEATVRKMEETYRAKGKLTKAQKGSLNKASDVILTGGKSTPLIDTGQMINSIHAVVELNSGKGKGEQK